MADCSPLQITRLRSIAILLSRSRRATACLRYMRLGNLWLPAGSCLTAPTSSSIFAKRHPMLTVCCAALIQPIFPSRRRQSTKRFSTSRPPRLLVSRCRQRCWYARTRLSNDPKARLHHAARRRGGGGRRYFARHALALIWSATRRKFQLGLIWLARCHADDRLRLGERDRSLVRFGVEQKP